MWTRPLRAMAVTARRSLLPTRRHFYTPYAVSTTEKILDSPSASSSVASSSVANVSISDEDGTFYSSYFQPRRDEVMDFLLNHNQNPFTTSIPGELMIPCPSCHGKRVSHPTHLTISGYPRMNGRISTRTGAYRCTNCTARGTWQEFVKGVRKKSGENFSVSNPSKALSSRIQPTFSRPLDEIERYPDAMNEDEDIRKWCTERMGITKQVLELYKVGVATYADFEAQLAAAKKSSVASDRLCLTFPQIAPDYTPPHSTTYLTSTHPPTRIVRIKACAAEPAHTFIAYDPPGLGPQGLFGYHVPPLSATSLILARDEFSAMAAYQQTEIPAVCLPTSNPQLPETAIPLLERFSCIYLWFDDDLEGEMLVDRLAHKLGRDRCLVVNTRGGGVEGPRNPHELLLHNPDKSVFTDLIKAAKPLKHEQIVQFRDLREQIRRNVNNPEAARGVQSMDLPGLNLLLKGHRPGELTIVTGATGIGKTTILSQLSLDFCKQGVATLWGSFEIPNARLAQKMICQLAEKDVTKVPDEFEVWANQFEQLPLYFLRFFGSTSIKDVLSACDHAVYAHDVSHVIIDNLQFMLSGQHRHHNSDRWETQDEAVSALRTFATDRNVHVSLVVHPRKEKYEKLGVSSVIGSAKVTQEADNVVIVQKIGATKFVDVKKNRFDGAVGAFPVIFDSESLKIRHLTDEESKTLRGQRAQSQDQTRPGNSSFRAPGRGFG
ncbi:twinkle protein putative [Jimgerdemannia flammicorona]|uniref:Twinkle protein putative n=1 Tax=Jimgerdemannia flammicorona TaxID=994334 RepID=A0A433QJ96_9FUNG|nr:twinkle protein putative [Jimgerdemannia flammicorona]